MANSKSKVFLPVEYPVLSPWEYIHAAVRAGLTQEQAKEVSGFNRGTWSNWLGYTPNRKPKKIRRAFRERLYRVASDMGWLDDGAIAA